MLSVVAALPALHNAMRMEEIKAYVTSPVRYDAATRPTLQLAQDAAAATGACLTTTPPPEARLHPVLRAACAILRKFIAIL